MNEITVSIGLHNGLIRESEQLRILKNFINDKDIICKSEIEKLIRAMEE